jgi:hypothetical protein
LLTVGDESTFVQIRLLLEFANPILLDHIRIARIPHGGLHIEHVHVVPIGKAHMQAGLAAKGVKNVGGYPSHSVKGSTSHCMLTDKEVHFPEAVVLEEFGGTVSHIRSCPAPHLNWIEA